MNILWIEDFGHLQPDSPTLINFFGGLIPHEIFDSHWPNEIRLRELPNVLKKFFSDYSDTHDLTLLRNYGDFLDQKGDFVLDHDVVAIDINLSSNASKEVPLPDGYTDFDDFHKKAGFYIYNRLIRMGFQDDHICFLTGEKGSTFEEFANHSRQALMPQPKAFGKDEVGMSDFRRWLDEHRKSDYTTLRRGTIEGCKTLQEIAKEPGRIRFNQFIKSDKDELEDGNVRDHLSSLMRFLPPHRQERDKKEPSTLTLRLFARAIVHEWDKKVDPHKEATTESRSLATVMKEARNYMMHGQALNQLSPQDVAYLFLVSMRAMFTLPQKPQRFEAILLSIFEKVPLPPSAKIEEDLKRSHERLLLEFERGGGPMGVSRNFCKLANKADECRIANIDYVVLLYQILWHQFTQKGEAYDALGYRCNVDFKKLGAEGSFLREFMESIYTRLLSDCYKPAPNTDSGLHG